jgi:predicted secreted Zn-dependent protease
VVAGTDATTERTRKAGQPGMSRITPEQAAKLEWIRAEVEDGSDEHCFEVAAGEGDLIHIRQTDEPEKIVTTTRAKWQAFVLGVQNNEFDHFVEDV